MRDVFPEGERWWVGGGEMICRMGPWLGLDSFFLGG